jgi:2-polyprenyl-3-methyl-5-hydroxy-6-metoxy-1,4-benzoquinol methylase
MSTSSVRVELGVDEAALGKVAQDLFRESPFLFRNLQCGRLKICPFELLIPQVPPGAAVLDIGCGRALFLGLLAALGQGSRLAGVDVSRGVIESAKRTAGLVQQKQLGEIELFLINPGEALPSGTFDVISIIDVLHHVKPSQQRDFMAAAFRHLAPGGILIYKDMVLKPSWRVWLNRMHDLVVAREWIHEVPIADVLSWAGEHGLQCIHSDLVTRLWYGHDIAIFRKQHHVSRGD